MFHGSIVALVTPMDKDGYIDYSALERLVEMHISAGTAAIVAAGTTGEAGMLDDAEKIQLIRRVVEIVAERIPVIAGTAATATQHAIELTCAAMQEGVDACLIMTPAYVKPTQEGLYQHYKAIAAAAAIPQILYNVPSRTACDLLPETLGRLAKISNIVGIKEATGSLERLNEIFQYCEDDLDVYSGDDATALDFILKGAKGVISVTANIVPRAMQQMCAAGLAARDDATKKAEAQTLNEQLMGLHHGLFVESNPIPVKWLLNYMGIVDSGIRLPLTVLSTQGQAVVLKAAQTAQVVPLD